MAYIMTKCNSEKSKKIFLRMVGIYVHIFDKITTMRKDEPIQKKKV
jgi:hypothetical protein